MSSDRCDKDVTKPRMSVFKSKNDVIFQIFRSAGKNLISLIVPYCAIKISCMLDLDGIGNKQTASSMTYLAS